MVHYWHTRREHSSEDPAVEGGCEDAIAHPMRCRPGARRVRADRQTGTVRKFLRCLCVVSAFFVRLPSAPPVRPRQSIQPETRQTPAT